MERTLKQLKENQDEVLKAIGEPIYKHKPYVIESKDGIIVAAEELETFLNDFIYSHSPSYYDECIFSIRIYDLHLADNTRINEAYCILG